MTVLQKPHSLDETKQNIHGRILNVTIRNYKLVSNMGKRENACIVGNYGHFQILLQDCKNNFDCRMKILYTGCFRKNSKYFRRWQCGLFLVNKFIQTFVQFSMGVKIQLFEVGAYRSDFCLWGWMKSEVYIEKSKHKRRIGRSHYEQCCPHKARTPRRPQESYTYCCQES